MLSLITKPIGCLFSLVGAIVLLAAGLVLGGMWLLSAMMPTLAEKTITRATGFPAEVGDSSLSYFSTRLELEDVRVNNPENYPERDFLLIRSAVIGLDRKASTRDSLVFDDISLNIDTLTLVRGTGIAVNLTEMLSALLEALIDDAEAAAMPTAQPSASLQSRAIAALTQQPQSANGLTVRFDPPATASASAYAAGPNGAATGQPAPPWLIRSLTIRVGNARLFESTVQGNLLRLVPLNYERRFSDVTSLKNVIPAILGDLVRRGLPLGY